MPSNILDAIMNIIESGSFDLAPAQDSDDVFSDMSDALECYIKDAFAGTFGDIEIDQRNQKYADVFFAYLGNLLNPPDMILKGGDAVEVKKIESDNDDIALKSSYPRRSLHSSNPLITKACRDCELWQEKDIIYAVGCVKHGKLKTLMMVYGENYAASSESYEKLELTLKKRGVHTIRELKFSETREYGRVDKVDPLGRTHLLVKGLWYIANPIRAFSYIYKKDDNADFNFMVLMSEDKYKSFSGSDIKVFEEFVVLNDNLIVSDVNINDTDNPAKLVKAKLIRYSV